MKNKITKTLTGYKVKKKDATWYVGDIKQVREVLEYE